MRFDLFQQIIRRIHRDVHCPKCEKRLHETDLEVLGMSHELVELATICPGCQSIVDILAHIELHHAGGGGIKPLQMRSITRKHLSPDSVRKISEAVRGFSGTDIQELFSS